MELQSKATVYAALGGTLALMGGIVYYAGLDNVDLEQVEVELAAVELGDVNRATGRAELDVTFLVRNPSDKTFTVSLITYELYGDGRLLGSGQYSTADIALPGRAVFYAGAEVPLESRFVIEKAPGNADAYDAAVGGGIGSYSAEGIITAESSWSVVEKEFRAGT
ncbi:MAG: hypothetical protein MPI95_07025 [Nitrosopumilus sp.]|nr:hypothetical protein [Nitrosopumilus sp.]MDA7942455.1 hypothetical protein [Nitrosopumilus sp.]MDA7953528.1 hypothetical protein [Nitrosopumilus sp.]MDA7958819.1 hypothetical protein [Nitrosopumilus sp.]MDA7960233.1 hypothetical protein [Nitrosopumilus sp.]